MVGCVFSTKKAFILDPNHFSKPFYKKHLNHPPAIFQGGRPGHELPADAGSGDGAGR